MEVCMATYKVSQLEGFAWEPSAEHYSNTLQNLNCEFYSVLLYVIVIFKTGTLFSKIWQSKG